MKAKCLYCYKALNADEHDLHASCSRKIFGQFPPPELPYSEEELQPLAEQLIKRQTTVTGVQPKLSLHIASSENDRAVKRFNIVGLRGGYILKPPTPHYPQLPEVEDLTMNLAAIAKIQVVPHSLIRLRSGNLAYITKRIDRSKKQKIHMEDMCQLTERLTEDKYHGSYEQIAKTIQKYSSNPGLDVINFFELVLFSYLTGNSDMHLKNFSLISRPGMGPVLCPAYDLLSTVLVNPDDKEELALTLNAKKKKIRKSDFIAAFTTLKLDTKQQSNIFGKMIQSKQSWIEKINESFLSTAFKKQLINLLNERLAKISE
jgi:serine/threonine-protein kinase HipA